MLLRALVENTRYPAYDMMFFDILCTIGHVTDVLRQWLDFISSECTRNALRIGKNAEIRLEIIRILDRIVGL